MLSQPITPPREKLRNEPDARASRPLFVALISLSLLVFAAPAAALFKLSWNDGRYAHTIFIPAIAAAIGWLELGRMRHFLLFSLDLPKPALGAVLFSLALILHAATPATNLTLQITALVLAWIGAVVSFYGLAARFAILLLVLTIPPPATVMDQFSATLQSASAELSHILFLAAGVPVHRQGTVFSLPGLTIEVAEQCSGIRSTIALVISSLLVACFALRTHTNRIAFVLATAFTAIFKNAVRIVFLSTMAVYVDERMLHGLLHHTYGGTVFSIVALALLAPLLYFLRRMEAAPGRLTRLATATLLLTLTACRRDAATAQKQHLQSAQAYATKSDFKSAIVEYRNTLQYAGRNAGVLHELAQAYLANRQPREAHAALMEAAAIDPERTSIRLDLGRLYLAANDFQKAEEHASHVARKEPGNIAAQQILGASLAGQNQPAKALQVYEHIAELAPNDAVSLLNLGSSQVAAGKITEAERTFRQVLELDPQQPRAYLALAGILAAQSKPEPLEALLAQLKERIRKPETAAAIGDFFASRNQRDRAIAEYRAGLDLSPSGLDLKARLVEQHLAAGQISDAAKWNGEILRARPKELSAGLAQGRILLASGKPDEAINHLRQVVSQARDSAAAHHYLGIAYAARMQHAQAKAELQEAIRADGGYLPPHISLAELHAALNELAPAREVAAAAVRKFPANPALRLLLASVLLRERNVAAAQEHLSYLQTAAPRDPAVHVLLGVSHAAEQKWDDAQQAFETALRLNPRYTAALAELTAMRVSNGQAGKALARLREHTTAYRDDADAYLLLGALARRLRDTSTAQTALSRAVELAPSNAQARVQLGGLHEDQGRLDAAIQHYELALQIAPQSPGIHAIVGTARLKKGDIALARKQLHQGLGLDPNSPVIANNLAVAQSLERGGLDEAMALAQKARELAPDLVHTADTLGWIQYQKGLYPSAIRHLEEAVRKSPGSGTFQYHLGMALIAAGQKERGRGHLESAVRLNLDADDDAEARSALAKLR